MVVNIAKADALKTKGTPVDPITRYTDQRTDYVIIFMIYDLCMMLITQKALLGPYILKSQFYPNCCIGYWHSIKQCLISCVKTLVNTHIFCYVCIYTLYVVTKPVVTLRGA